MKRWSEKRGVKRKGIDININLSKTEGKSIVWKEIHLEWQEYWEQETKGRHLYSLLNKVNSTVELSRWVGWKRKEQVIMTRMRIGHTNLNGTLKIIGKHPTGLCQKCQQPETVQHILITCRSYERERETRCILK